MKIQKNISVKNKNTFRIGGKVKYYAKPEKISDFIELVDFSKRENVNIIVLGGGANILFPDEYLDALVVSTEGFNGFTVEGSRVVIGAGYSVDKAAKKLAELGLSGMEFAGGLPGSIGGAVYMNARCYGSEFSEIVESVTVADRESNTIVLKKEELEYSYKKSIFMKRPDLLIVEVEFNLKPKDKKEVLAVYNNNYNDRKIKGQFAFPSAGCVFKNDYNTGISSGKLIDESGLKNKAVGDAEIYEKHANFIINKKNAKASDVLSLVKIITEKVEETRGIKLEKELRVIDCLKKDFIE